MRKICILLGVMLVMFVGTAFTCADVALAGNEQVVPKGMSTAFVLEGKMVSLQSRSSNRLKFIDRLDKTEKQRKKMAFHFWKKKKWKGILNLLSNASLLSQDADWRKALFRTHISTFSQA